MAERKNGVLNWAAVRRLVKSARPGTRASHEYLASLQAHLHDRILDDVRRNGSKKTLRADLLIPIPSRPRGRR